MALSQTNSPKECSPRFHGGGKIRDRGSNGRLVPSHAILRAGNWVIEQKGLDGKKTVPEG